MKHTNEIEKKYWNKRDVKILTIPITLYAKRNTVQPFFTTDTSGNIFRRMH